VSFIVRSQIVHLILSPTTPYTLARRLMNTDVQDDDTHPTNQHVNRNSPERHPNCWITRDSERSFIHSDDREVRSRVSGH